MYGNADHKRDEYLKLARHETAVAVRLEKMPSLEESFTTAIAGGKIPGTVLMASDKTGIFQFSKAFGPSTLHEPKNDLKLDAVFILASFTKLITTIAALQLVERGKWTLDGNVFGMLPELETLPILIGMKDGRAVLKKREKEITLRCATLRETDESNVSIFLTNS
jgi:CubicO group peptidase (beta-lactamase class C family)